MNLRGWREEVETAAAQAVLQLTFAAHHAFEMVDAIVTTIVRLAV